MFDLSAANNPIVVIAAFLLVLIPAVFIHELGHLIAAKLVGITILEFGVGMPPRLVKLFTWRGTEYTLNWLPLGGFVRPLGEDMVRQMGDEALQSDRDIAIERGFTHPVSVNEAKPLGRIFFMAGGAIANFIMAFVIFVIIGLSGLPQLVGARVELRYVPSESAWSDSGLQAGDIIQAVNGEYFADAAGLLSALQMVGDETTLTVIRPASGEETFIVTVQNLDVSSLTLETHPIVQQVAPGSPAAEAGLQRNDLVTMLNTQPVANFDELQALTAENLGQEVSLTVLRDGELVTVNLTPREHPPEGQGAMGIQITGGAAVPETGMVIADSIPVQELVPLSIGESAQYSLGRIGMVLEQMAQLPVQLFNMVFNSAPPSENMRITSPLGISQVGGLLLQESIQQERPAIILEYIGLISLALGITNLLPIPALDGGRILFVLIEIVRGRPIAPEREGMVHLVGIALLLSLMVVVVLNDIANPLTDILR
ncbi:MAG: RIP metalloprotease RseP [Anaerolineae bacterium]|nr:RIP metalloprotease RseP [Anaerolineae bacterium]